MYCHLRLIVYAIQNLTESVDLRGYITSVISKLFLMQLVVHDFLEANNIQNYLYVNK